MLMVHLSTRRSFLSTATALFAASGAAATPKSTWKVGIIGHTGRGNYGHGLDTVWLKLPATKIVAVADADPTGLARAKMRLGIERGYPSYEQMLEDEQLDIVAVCPRHLDQHHAMVMASIRAGVKGIYVEKPFVRTPREADEIIDAGQSQKVKIAIAHRNRYHPVLPAIDRFLAAGQLGKILEIRGRGKGDHRGGGEDLWVLGSHVLNLMHYFGGDPKSCSAIMLQDGRPVTAADVVDGNEGLGPLAGNELHARFEMAGGPIAYFDSIANDGSGGAGFGLQLIGTKGIINLQCDQNPLAHFIPGNPFQPTDTPRPWLPLTTAGVGEPETRSDLIRAVANHQAAANDLIDAIEQDRAPRCDQQQGATTVEMICGVFESHRLGGATVTLPLSERDHPLSRL